MKRIFLTVLLTALILPTQVGNSCTNFIVTKGASVDGSVMVSYTADSYEAYGELYHYPAAVYQNGAWLEIYEWDTGEYRGKIKQVLHTYSVVGNMNEHQLAIGETTYGGREELHNPDAIMDYGGLIYITLQRAKNAREAIKIIGELLDEYGYRSEGESFSISDPNEVWILEMIGKGKGNHGAVWVPEESPTAISVPTQTRQGLQLFP